MCYFGCLWPRRCADGLWAEASRDRRGAVELKQIAEAVS